MTRPTNDVRVSGLEGTVGRVLKLGVTSSSVCLGFGLALTFLGVELWMADRLLQIGLIVLLATPVARVVVSVVDYLQERDWAFAALTLVVLLQLAASVLAAMYGVAG